MIPSSEEMHIICHIVVEQCNAQARQWKACGSDAAAAVLVKVCENLGSVEHLEKPLEHYVRRTAVREARRFFRTEKNAVRSCVAVGALENLESVVERSHPTCKQSKRAARKRKCIVDALDRQCRRRGDSSELESLVKTETRERLLKAVRESPSDRREALLVHAGAQACDSEGADLPRSIRELARQRGCSPQHLCNLAAQEKRRLKKHLQ